MRQRGWATALPPEVASVAVESAALARPHASPLAKRRAELHLGRYCARRALGLLGLPPASIASGSHGEPCWPPGIVGSITHCDGFAAAAVASTRHLHAIGIDAEPIRTDVDGLAATVATEGEIAAVAAGSRQLAVTLLASAKESVFKALFPLVGRWFDFSAVEIAHWQQDEFTGHVVEALGEAWPVGAIVQGRHAVEHSRVYTTCVVDRPPARVIYRPPARVIYRPPAHVDFT